jgi:hypothetical protein
MLKSFQQNFPRNQKRFLEGTQDTWPSSITCKKFQIRFGNYRRATSKEYLRLPRLKRNIVFGEADPPFSAREKLRVVLRVSVSPITYHFSVITCRSQDRYGRGAGVGRILGVGLDLGVGLGRGVDVAVGVGVGEPACAQYLPPVFK